LDAAREEAVFYVVRDEIFRARYKDSSVEFCTGGCEESISVRKVESPLLAAVARERLMKTQQAEKSLTSSWCCSDM
jgi:hypothetical protein